MKTNFIKKSVLLAVMALILVMSSAFITKKTTPNLEDGTYFFLAVSGVHQKNNAAYVSNVIYYSENCSNQKKEVFHREAKIAFNNYLKARYNDEFPYGSNNISVHEYRGTTAQTGEYMFTRQQATTRINSWAGNEESDGYKVLYTDFGFSCE